MIASLWGVFITFEDDAWTYHQSSTRAGDISLVSPNVHNRPEVPFSVVIDRINSISTPRNNAWFFVVAGAACAILVHMLHRPLFAALLLVLCLFLAYRADLYVRSRGTFMLQYHRSPLVKTRWDALNHMLTALAKSNDVWSEPPTADAEIEEAPHLAISISRASPPRIVSSLVPYRMIVAGKSLYFMPDHLYTVENGIVNAIAYTEVNVQWSQRYSKNEKEANRSGASNRDEYEDPGYGEDENVVEIGESMGMSDEIKEGSVSTCGALRISADFGLDFTLYMGNPELARRAASDYRKFLKGEAVPRDVAKASARKKSRAESSSNGTVPSHLFETLGVAPNCTKEEAAARYRALVEAYHPDRIAKIAPQFKDAANKQLATIHDSYKELCRLRGW
jgi:hypothetical protein